LKTKTNQAERKTNSKLKQRRRIHDKNMRSIVQIDARRFALTDLILPADYTIFMVRKVVCSLSDYDILMVRATIHSIL
jgi:hypothetical protein